MHSIRKETIMTDLERLREMIESHHKIAFFGGAGVSTESHIPDFRGANGIYRQKTNLPWTPEEMLSHHFYEEHPVEFFTNYKNFAEEGSLCSGQAGGRRKTPWYCYPEY